jgi:hypothetical protein
MVYGNGSLKVGNGTKIRDVRGIGSLTGVGGGGQGVRGWPRPGGRYTRMPDPGRGHTPPRGGARGAGGLDPIRRGGPY